MLAALPEGTPRRQVLLLHGIGGNAHSCEAAADLLSARGVAAYSWDAPGYGESADPSGETDLVVQVVQTLDQLGLDRVDLFGTSWGGVIAAQVAHRHSRRLRSLILADSTRGLAVNPEKAQAMRERVSLLDRLGSDAFAASRAPRLVSPQAGADIRERVRAEMTRVRPVGNTMAAEFMADADNTDLLRQLELPTLVVVGADDVVTGVPESELLAELVPGARFEVLPDAGHSAVTERPEAMVAVMTRFWEEIDD
ncbi:alpha/beta hydrolase [Enemella dayhoffiae]|uniref:Alpha/beta hydrolase n=1 Tax=Enemella dayhoffiae TaxID=2016507 RepID=A0A255GUI1_9ACTN|nr:alpha/beta hydrolase [Enemella dayhoffiae]